MTNYEVIVGNIGLVHEGSSLDRALAVFHTYVELSDARVGRCDGESVMLMADGHLIDEHFGKETDADGD